MPFASCVGACVGAQRRLHLSTAGHLALWLRHSPHDAPILAAAEAPILSFFFFFPPDRGRMETEPKKVPVKMAPFLVAGAGMAMMVLLGRVAAEPSPGGWDPVDSAGAHRHAALGLFPAPALTAR